MAGKLIEEWEPKGPLRLGQFSPGRYGPASLFDISGDDWRHIVFGGCYTLFPEVQLRAVDVLLMSIVSRTGVSRRLATLVGCFRVTGRGVSSNPPRMNR